MGDPGPEADPSYAELLDDRLRQAAEQRASLLSAIEQMRVARSLTSADDEHDPEGSTVSLDQARDSALLVRTEQTLAELVAARDRLAAGRFGVCERCGRPIPEARLRARPEARLCVACAGLRPPSPGRRPGPR
ncbi:RNA polymerase-binding transcription factor DksA [Friedmanniella luteola]|uniref:RNA polymerase-binding transcription factor DksA n=1 Tax=Friedmanniella luteola TaxID=546871 RepID=A0A1H1VRJ7_9ACTN|nr:TraR/DksA C4-type zinc finger protein [Friedmanniella luteola]SDS87588.1 RNA polymerase-binding transcription factor DksA [Friedmanniella luteola]